MHCFQEPLPFVALLHQVLLQPGRERRKDRNLRKAIEVLSDNVPDASVEHLAALTHYQLVAKRVSYFEGVLLSIIMLNITDDRAELRPGFINGDIWVMLN